jgi:hypothetical protein
LFGVFVLGEKMENPTLSGSNSDTRGATNSAPLTRIIFSSNEYGVKVEKRQDGFYVLSCRYGSHETRDLTMLLLLLGIYTDKRTVELLSKKLKGE